MSDKKIFSVIIPTLNEEKQIEKILLQLSEPKLRDKYNYEIIVSDGGSTDKTIEIASKYADIVRLCNPNEKQTISLGRNLGAKEASGEVLIFINGDILLKNPYDFFAYITSNFLNTNYLAMTFRVKINPEEEILKDKIFHFIYNAYFRFLNEIGIGMGRGECQIVLKEVFEEVEGYNPNMVAGEDFDLFIRIKNKGKILFSKEIFIHESPRRFRKYGYLKVTSLWIKNGFSVFFKHKSVSKEWEQVR